MPQMRALGKYGGEIQIGGLVLGTWLQSRPSRELLRRWSSTPLLSQRLSLCAIKPRCTTGMNGGSRAGNMCMCWRPSEPKKSEAKASAKGKPLSAHKFNLGQRVEYRPPSGTSASHGTHVIVAKLGEQGGEFEYYIRSVTQEQDERMARESELNAVGDRSPS